jgi:DNA polymerase III subunit epsilon
MIEFDWIGMEGDTVTLQALKDFKSQEKAKNPGSAVIVDVETTGLNFEDDEIIELGALVVEYDKDTKKITRVLKEFNQLQEPNKPLTDKIVQLTKITEESLKGHSIDWNEFDDLIKDVDFVIAHNSSFDRSFLDVKSEVSREKPWVCSLVDIDWASRGYLIQKLEVLSIYHGFFNKNAHRALDDCKAVLELLTFKDYMDVLIQASNTMNYVLFAKNTPFKTKDTFNSLEFRWEAKQKVWFKTYIDKETAKEDKERLKRDVYNHKVNSDYGVMQVPPKHKFKALKNILKSEPVLHGNTANKFTKKFRILASKAPYEKKNELKSRGYFWSPNEKSWYLYVTEEESEIEKKWLKKEIYSNTFLGRIEHNSFYGKE